MVKLAGEEYVRDLLERYYIVHTAWLCGYPGQNFVGKVLAPAETEEKLSVAANEFGSPTCARQLGLVLRRWEEALSAYFEDRQRA